jgi:hypothetical protein
VEVRDATAQDWPAIWPSLHEIVAAGETYAYDRELTEDQARRLWMVGPPGRTAVRLWQSLGFAVIGTVPEAFAHPTHGYVGLHVMHRRL